MKTLKIEKLTGLTLDYAVAILINGKDKVTIGTTDEGTRKVVLVDFNGVWRKYEPTTDFTLGFSILQAAHVSITCDSSGVWVAFSKYNSLDEARFMVAGTTMLEAGLRCLVKSKIGAAVDVPEELLG